MRLGGAGISADLTAFKCSVKKVGELVVIGKQCVLKLMQPRKAQFQPFLKYFRVPGLLVSSRPARQCPAQGHIDSLLRMGIAAVCHTHISSVKCESNLISVHS